MNSLIPKLIVTGPLIAVLALIALGYLGERWTAAAQIVPACGSALMQDQVRSAMFVALDDAFREHVASLHIVMMKEHNRAATERAKAGVDLAVNGYLHSYSAISNWSLPPCR